MNYNGDIHFSFFFQADACYFLAQLISETTNPIKRGVGQDTSDKIESSIKNSEPSVAEKILRMAMQKKWIPTEKIIKMWVPSLKGSKSVLGADRGSDSGIDLLEQRMRSSVQSDSLNVCFRLSKEEYY